MAKGQIQQILQLSKMLMNEEAQKLQKDYQEN